MTIKLRSKACIGIKQFYSVNLPYIKVDSDKSSKNHQSPEASTYEKVPGESISLFQISVNYNLLRKGDTKMEMTLNNGFCEMTGNEMLAVDGGGWAEFGYALLGTVCFAGAPIALAMGQPWASVALVGTGLYQYGNL